MKKSLLALAALALLAACAGSGTGKTETGPVAIGYRLHLLA